MRGQSYAQANCEHYEEPLACGSCAVANPQHVPHAETHDYAEPVLQNSINLKVETQAMTSTDEAPVYSIIYGPGNGGCAACQKLTPVDTICITETEQSN